jgi:hypothetical protein
VAAILALVQELLNLAFQILGIAKIIQGNQGDQAVEHTAFAIETIAANGTNVLINPTHGNAALLAAINALSVDLAAARVDILDEITAIDIPTPPTPAEVADGVWNAVDPLTDPTVPRTFGQHANRVGVFADSLEHGLSLPALVPEHFHVEFVDQQKVGLRNLFNRPETPWADVLPSDTRMSWLARNNPEFTWGYATDSTTVVGNSTDPLCSNNRWAFDLTEAEFQSIANIGPRAGMPIWPGIANVTLGTPIALAAHIHSYEPCHGVILNITTWPEAYSRYDWGDTDQYPRAGYISFTNDDGDQTAVLSLTFPWETIMCPLMVKAMGFYVRTRPAVVGTITPFLINAA